MTATAVARRLWENIEDRTIDADTFAARQAAIWADAEARGLDFVHAVYAVLEGAH